MLLALHVEVERDLGVDADAGGGLELAGDVEDGVGPVADEHDGEGRGASAGGRV